MQRRSERGEGRLSGLFWLVVLALVFFAVWNVGPAYYAHYSLQDRMNEIARTGYMVKEEDMRLSLLEATREYGLDGYIAMSDFVLRRNPGRFVISVAYDRDIRVLPGWSRTFHFEAEADQPNF